MAIATRILFQTSQTGQMVAEYSSAIPYVFRNINGYFNLNIIANNANRPARRIVNIGKHA